MKNSSVLYRKESGAQDCHQQTISDCDLHYIINKLYHVDVHQPLVKVQQKILEIITGSICIESILWHSEIEKNAIDINLLLQEHGLQSLDVTPFDVKLDDSNIHHYIFAAFPVTCKESEVKARRAYLSSLLYLIAEIYRQTIINSYYQEWKKLPFTKYHQLVDQAELLASDNTILANSPKAIIEEWEEIKEANQSIIVRKQRVENQLFIDKFQIPKAINSLTFKQKQICFYLKACCSNQQIAELLRVSIKTVGNHLSAIYDKLGVSRSQLFQILNTIEQGDTEPHNELNLNEYS